MFVARTREDQLAIERLRQRARRSWGLFVEECSRVGQAEQDYEAGREVTGRLGQLFPPRKT